MENIIFMGDDEFSSILYTFGLPSDNYTIELTAVESKGDNGTISDIIAKRIRPKDWDKHAYGCVIGEGWFKKGAYRFCQDFEPYGSEPQWILFGIDANIIENTVDIIGAKTFFNGMRGIYYVCLPISVVAEWTRLSYDKIRKSLA